MESQTQRSGKNLIASYEEHRDSLLWFLVLGSSHVTLSHNTEAGQLADCLAHIQAESDELLSKGVLLEKYGQQLDIEVSKQKDFIDHQRIVLHAPEVTKALEKRKLLEIELQIRRLHTVVVQLESPTLENEGATGLVYQALACAPRPLPPNTQTASVLFTACKCLQQRLTSNFHEEYESAMTGGGGTGTTSEQRDPGRMWAVFVATASPRLLSVLLAALLPAALSESRLGECLFRAALDAALTPLWSRFYFHLERALEDGSSQQILWTFRYARSHVKMLAALAAQVATHPCLEALGLQVDWAQAARAGIADKTCVFLRAHVAKVLSPLPQSPPQQHQHQQSLVASTAGLQLIEEALESDRCLCTVHGGPLGPAERVTGVLRDHPEARRLWREVDRHFFLGTLTEACLPGSQQPASQAFSSSNAPDPFENKSYPIDDQRLRVRSGLSIAQSKSSTIFPLSIACALVSGRSHNSSSSSSNHCDINADLPRHVFCAVFEGVHLLSLACRRYYWTDVQTQKLFSEAVVEPLLAALLGLLLFRVRENPVLVAISCGALKKNSVPQESNLTTGSYNNRSSSSSNRDNHSSATHENDRPSANRSGWAQGEDPIATARCTSSTQTTSKGIVTTTTATLDHEDIENIDMSTSVKVCEKASGAEEENECYESRGDNNSSSSSSSQRKDKSLDNAADNTKIRSVRRRVDGISPNGNNYYDNNSESDSSDGDGDGDGDAKSWVPGSLKSQCPKSRKRLPPEARSYMCSLSFLVDALHCLEESPAADLQGSGAIPEKFARLWKDLRGWLTEAVQISKDVNARHQAAGEPTEQFASAVVYHVRELTALTEAQIQARTAAALPAPEDCLRATLAHARMHALAVREAFMLMLHHG